MNVPPPSSSGPKNSLPSAAFAKCTLESSWVFCAAGCAAAVPLGIRARSFAPLLYLGAGGTLADAALSWYRCSSLLAAAGAPAPPEDPAAGGR